MFSIARLPLIAGLCLCLYGLSSALANNAPTVLAFSPTGTLKGVRQVQVRFATPMVTLGDPRLPSPFDIDCPPGSGRWADPRHWIFDFVQDLPAGMRCRFSLRANAQDAAGARLIGERTFRFDTGGPAILQTEPWAGSTIDEEQIFILGLDAPATDDSLLTHAQCRVDGLADAIGVRVITGKERRLLLEANPYFLRRYVDVLFKDPAAAKLVANSVTEEDAVRARFLTLIQGPSSPLALVQCKQRLPNGHKVWLDLGAGIRTASGVTTTESQSLQFETREAFRARFQCARANQDAACIPALGMTLEFTAAVSTHDAMQITLTGADGKVYPVKASSEAQAETTSAVSFAGPFPARAKFTLTVPPLVDDAERTLINQDRFPLAVATGDDPPLAKFAADFGIVELSSPVLPVTVRNLEANLRHGTAPPPPAAPSVGGFVKELLHLETTDYLQNPVVTTLRGKVLKFAADDPVVLGGWLTALRSAQRDHYRWDDKHARYVVTKRAGETALLAAQPQARALEIPRATHAKAFEVVGIPLKQPGFYLVELASPRLGAALFGKPDVYYVQSLALVTNLGVHLKWGRESSLVWVTALDSARPVPGAAVTIKDCKGETHWHGTTDREGIAAIELELPLPAELPRCDWNSQGLLASAQLGADIGVVASDWNEGIENWQFNLPSPESRAPEIATTVFDRTLLRTGETVHMKHLLRTHTRRGFDALRVSPFTGRIRHADSADEFPLNATFEAATSSAESIWTIPAHAKQGTYRVEYQIGDAWSPLGDFRVESYRVPLLRATVHAPATPAIAADTLRFDVQAQYLAGGAAADLPVTLRGLIQPREVRFAAYEDFVFMNGNVAEGIVDQAEPAWGYQPSQRHANQAQLLGVQTTTLDAAGGAQLTLRDLPLRDAAQMLTTELEYADPNGEILIAATRVPLWPAQIVLGIKPDGWAMSQANLNFDVLALSVDGMPAAGVDVVVDLLQRVTYSHRKRLIGGFYAYENTVEIKRLAARCTGTSDAFGRLRCQVKSPVSGNVILRAAATDAAGHASYANRDVWVGGGDDWWFSANNEDRMEVLPERSHYEPEETARLQVRMPFRTATALVTVEREGIIQRFVAPLSGRSPVIEIPMRGHYAPNVFVSVLAVRGREANAPTTALVDLGKPAYKLGFAELQVGWRAHTLDVKVHADRETYKVRERAQVEIQVAAADGSALGAHAEVIVAAVDEGLLELRANESWQLLSAMMGRRGAEVRTATAQMQVIGKRHFGRKAVAPGGGGGQTNGTRQLFDTLLKWQTKVALDATGKATLEIPLNDSLTSFRIVAIATAGNDRFGTGATSIRTTQDLMVFSGLPPVVRETDRYAARFTVRNSASHAFTMTAAPELAVESVAGKVPYPSTLAPQTLTLAAGQSQELTWDIVAPLEALRLHWTLHAYDPSNPDTRDALSATQQVLAAVPVRTFQASVAQLTAPQSLPVALPAGAQQGRGDLQVTLQPRLANTLAGVREYMTDYGYGCLEQLVSKAVALQDETRWAAAMALLPTYLDGHGLAKYFVVEGPGSDTLTAYLLAIAHEAGWTIPAATRLRLREALVQFIEGRLTRESPWQTADLSLRKLTAIEALSRLPEGIDVRWLDALDIVPNQWPTSGVIDWIDILRRVDGIPARDQQLASALKVLRARLDFQGTTLNFSTAREDALWWLMITADVNANRALLSVLDRADWAEDAPRLVTGSLGRQLNGHWSTTNANAWGVLAMKKFSARFEATPVTGHTNFGLADARRVIDWQTQPEGTTTALPWPASPATLGITHDGQGAPWVSWRARAAIPLKRPLQSGYQVRRAVTPVAQRTPGAWHPGDVYRVRLEITAQADMTWVVVRDPIPAGASVLGTGLGKDSQIMADAAQRDGWVWPIFEERTLASFRAYYRFVPKGDWVVEYTVRLNNAGEFYLPATRVEAMYAPERFAELPNDRLLVLP